MSEQKKGNKKEEGLLPFPHDSAFKAAMSNKQVAQDFFQHYLPESIKQQIHLETLTVKNGSFIEPQLKKKATDMLYQVDFDAKGSIKQGFLYVLCEHQSTPDKLMPLRLWHYVCLIMMQHLKEYPKTKQIPLVFPLVFYNGENPYSYSTDFFDLFAEEQKELARSILLKPFTLIDLNKIPNEEIRKHKWTALMELLMKHAIARNILSHFEIIEEKMREMLRDGLADYVKSMVYYTLEFCESDDIELLINRLRELPKPVGDEVMTIAQVLEARAREQGIQQGIQQGIEQGIEQGMSKLVKEMLRHTNDIEIISRMTGLSAEEIKKLCH